MAKQQQPDEWQSVDYDPADYDLQPEEAVTVYEHHRVKADPKQQLLRVDRFLVIMLGISRSRIKSAADAGFLFVNGEPKKANYKVRPGDEVVLALPFPPENRLLPEDIPLNIHYEDEAVIVVNKPPGMVVHPGAGNYKGTLINALLYHVQQQGETLEKRDGEDVRPGLAHRIDKETSGLLAIAKSEAYLDYLQKQFQERTTERRYIAIVWGDVKDDAGTIDAPIGRSRSDRKKFTVVKPDEGRHAVTHYRVLHRFGEFTVIECKLETGRTHQIRVHMKHLGHTLLGDKYYGGDKFVRGRPSRAYRRLIHELFELMPRHALHAKTLGFEHPQTKDFLHFNSELPADFQAVLETLGSFFERPWTFPAE